MTSAATKMIVPKKMMQANHAGRAWTESER
jgi:hypothetical protein